MNYNDVLSLKYVCASICGVCLVSSWRKLKLLSDSPRNSLEMAPVFLVTGYLQQIPTLRATHSPVAGKSREMDGVSSTSRVTLASQAQHNCRKETGLSPGGTSVRGMPQLGPWAFPVLRHAPSLLCVWLAPWFSGRQQA